MTDIQIVPLGAGQDVGRSCILLTIGGKNIMLDCGMHMGFNDDRRFPDFSYINKTGPLTDFIDCVIISHFHLDHCGALPYMSEMVGYAGPIYMTYPTKAICPILLEDYRKITVEQKGETNFFTFEMIRNCMKKVIPVNLHQQLDVDAELSIKAYYAGHVLGAAMFHIKVGNQSVVYTGDYNMTPDRHLGAARIDKCRPDVLITESTYATTIRDSKRCREQDFLKKVHKTVENGGKVLIPVFALGRAQELCILLETYWDQKNLKTPIYFTTGLTDKATNFYKLFITWTNEKIKNTFVERNMFDFKHISPFDRNLMDLNEPMVVFATPGMLHGGLSLQIFKKWCHNEKNMIIMPGYCVNGTVGWRILNGQKILDFDGRKVEVKMMVEYMSFSAHADAKGIMQLVKQSEPKSVVLVHGEAVKMKFLVEKMQQEFSMACYMPANGESITIPSTTALSINMTTKLFKKITNLPDTIPPMPKNTFFVHGALACKDKVITLEDYDEVFTHLNVKEHIIRFTNSFELKTSVPINTLNNQIYQLAKESIEGFSIVVNKDKSIKISDSLVIKLSTLENQASKMCLISWNLQDDDIASFITPLIKSAPFS